ncbi:TIGR04255 family protein [Micromonospora echinospora]
MRTSARVSMQGGTLYDGREVYASAPLELVAAEIRFTFVPSLARNEAREAVSDALRDLTPVPKLEKFYTFSLTKDDPPTPTTKEQFRLLNRENTLSIVVEPQRLVVETTEYNNFEGFRKVVARALQAVTEKQNIAGVERVGLRYVDEVRIPAPVTTARDWRGWIDERLLSSLEIRPDNPAESIQAITQYSTGPERHLRFRYGSVRGPSIVGGDGSLKTRKKHPPGPYFLLDIDSFWQSSDQIPTFEYEAVMEIVDGLHLPTGEIFSASITEKLKEEVFRKGDRDA